MKEEYITLTSTSNNTNSQPFEWIYINPESSSKTITSNEYFYTPPYPLDFIAFDESGTITGEDLEKIKMVLKWKEKGSTTIPEKYLPGEQMEFDFVRQIEKSVII